MTELDYSAWKRATLNEQLELYRDQCLRRAEQAMLQAANAMKEYRDSFNVERT